MRRDETREALGHQGVVLGAVGAAGPRVEALAEVLVELGEQWVQRVQHGRPGVRQFQHVRSDPERVRGAGDNVHGEPLRPVGVGLVGGGAVGEFLDGAAVEVDLAPA
ncbi:hypothetical protein [Kineococcus sp. SYSU DK002]|uniref:hypothetical protein n=1 Tax=Kineococcus sp. SYSU DK002 TaxID=3383123 RepID=UPI003D7DE1A8